MIIKILTAKEEFQKKRKEIQRIIPLLIKERKERQRERARIFKKFLEITKEEKRLLSNEREVRKKIRAIFTKKEKVGLELKKEEERKPKDLKEIMKWQERKWQWEDKKRQLEREETKREWEKLLLKEKLEKVKEELNQVDFQLRNFDEEIKEIEKSLREKKEELITLKKELFAKKEEAKMKKERDFQLALDYYRKGELNLASQILEEILAEKPKERFLKSLIRVFKGPSLEEKAEKFLGKIKGEIKALEEMKKEKEREFQELIAREKRKREIERKLREEYEARLKIQEEKFLEQKEELRKLRERLAQKEKEMEEKIKELMAKKVETEKEKELRKEMEKMKEELKREEERLREEHRQALESYREELEKIKEEKLLPPKEKGLAEEIEIYPKKAELFTRPEIMKRWEETIKREIERLREEEREMEKREKELETLELTEEERKEREERIKVIRERIREEVKRLAEEKAKIAKDKEIIRKEREEILEDLFNQSLAYYRERDLTKTKELALLIKEKIEEGKKQGIWEDVHQISIYGKTMALLASLEKEIEKEREEKLALIEKPKREGKPFRLRELLAISFERISNFLQRILFLRHPIFGLDISDYSCELVSLNRQKRILNSGRVILSRDIIVEGKVKNPEAFSLALASLFKEANLPKPKKGFELLAAVSLPEAQTFLQTFKIEGTKDLYQKVKNLAEETLPLSLEEVYWDFISSYDQKLNQTKILFVATPCEIIDEQMALLRENGIRPIIFEPEATSLARILFPEISKGGAIVLDIGAKITTINIFNSQGFIELSVTVPIASSYFTQRIAEVLNISLEKAKEEIENKGFLDKEDLLSQTLIKEAEKIIDELKKAIDYYQKENQKEIKRIILTGGSSLLPGIVDFFQSHFQSMEIVIADPLRQIKERREILKEPLFYTNALGLALRGILKDPFGEGINLLPKEVQKKAIEFLLKTQKRKLFLFRMGLILIFFLILGLIIYIAFFL